MILTEKFVREKIVEWLSRKGYSMRLRVKGESEHGIDIKVRHNKYARYYIVEVKGDPDPKKVKYPGSRREVSFTYVLGQIVSRMGNRAKYWYAIGLPESYEDKVLRRLPWQLCKQLRLNALLVNKYGKVKCITWNELKKYQSR